MEWLDSKCIKVDPPKRPKKITGTRFAALLGLSPWATPFSVWCEITRTYEAPFEDTKYTIAGKAIEPKQAQYLVDTYNAALVSPTAVYGENYFKTTRGDFFASNPIFGGMWDYLGVDSSGKYSRVFEMKTTKRSEDWADGKIPEYYALQAALYAYLLGIDYVTMVVTVLEDKDYDNPEAFEVNSQNTALRSFHVSERYPNFHVYVDTLTRWWQDHVITGLSPEYSEKADAAILRELRTATADTTENIDLAELLKDLDSLRGEIASALAIVNDLEAAYKDRADMLKSHADTLLNDNNDRVVYKSEHYEWVIARVIKNDIDKTKMQEDGVLDKYTIPRTSSRLTVNRKEP